MKYFKYISFYKKALNYWIALFFLAFIISILKMFVFKNVSGSVLNHFYFPGLLLVVFFGYHSLNYLVYKKQLKFKEIYKSNIVDSSHKKIQVEIFQVSFSIKLFKNNQEAKINIKPYLEEFETFKIGEDIILIGQVNDFGIFRRPLKPLIIKIGKNSIEYNEFSLIPKIFNLELDNKDLKIVFEKSTEGIKMLILKNYN
jgi:hypothetical protein